MRIPVIDAPSVSPAGALQNPAPSNYRGASYDTATSAIAHAASSIGEGIDRAIAKTQAQAEEVAVGDALLKYQRYGNGRLNGTPESDSIESAFEGRPSSAGFLRLRGVAASEASAGLVEDLEKERLKIASEISNPRARQEYARRSAQVHEEHRRAVEMHVGQQLGVAADATSRAQREMALNDIANNFRDPAAVARQQSIVEPLIRARQLSPEDGKAQLEEFQADAAKVRLGSYIASQDWAGAQSLFLQVREKLGTSAVQFQKTIEAGMIGARAEHEAASIIESSTDAGTGWVYSPRAMYELDQLPEGPLKDETRQRLEHRLRIADGQKKDAIDDRFNNALSALLKGGSLSAVNPADKTYLQDERNDPMKWVQLENIARSLQHGRRGGGSGGAVGIGAKLALVQLQVDMVDHPERYTQMSPQAFISEWWPKLDPRDWEQAGTMLAAAHGKALKPDQLSTTEVKALVQRGRERGIFPAKQNDVSKWGEEQASLYYDAINQLQSWAAAEKLQTGKAPTFEKMQAEIDRLLLPGFKPDTGFMGFFRKKTTPLQAGEEGGFVPDWTDTQKAEAVARIKAKGLQPTDALVDQILRRMYRLPAPPVQRAEPQTSPATESSPGPTALERSTNRKTDRVY